jgi:hypothetical protein
MNTALTKEDVLHVLEELPSEGLVEVWEFLEFLRFKYRRQAHKPVRLGGLWKGLPPITEADIAEARGE